MKDNVFLYPFIIQILTPSQHVSSCGKYCMLLFWHHCSYINSFSINWIFRSIETRSRLKLMHFESPRVIIWNNTFHLYKFDKLSILSSQRVIKLFLEGERNLFYHSIMILSKKLRKISPPWTLYWLSLNRKIIAFHWFLTSWKLVIIIDEWN